MRWAFLPAHKMDRIRWELFYSSNKHLCRMYLCKYRGSYRGVCRMGGFFLFFPLQSCLLFLCHWAGAFSFFIQTGFYGVLHIIKHVFFSHHIFYFRISPARTASIGYFASSLLFFFLRLGGRIFSSERKRKKGRERLKKKERCDGWKGEGGETMEVSLFSLVG